ncbi:MAG TPA: hypothetical protein VH561_16830 [Micromonosporaceae bacterium]|jgi:hypothetical protein
MDAAKPAAKRTTARERAGVQRRRDFLTGNFSGTLSFLTDPDGPEAEAAMRNAIAGMPMHERKPIIDALNAAITLLQGTDYVPDAA